MAGRSLSVLCFGQSCLLNILQWFKLMDSTFVLEQERKQVAFSIAPPSGGSPELPVGECCFGMHLLIVPVLWCKLIKVPSQGAVEESLAPPAVGES